MYIVYGGSDCAYCDKAKALLEIKGLEFQFIDVRSDTNKRDEMMDIISSLGLPEPMTIPQIFIKDGSVMKYVGGFSELSTLLRTFTSEIL